MCSRNSPYSLNCHEGAMLVFRMLSDLREIATHLGNFISKAHKIIKLT